MQDEQSVVEPNVDEELQHSRAVVAKLKTACEAAFAWMSNVNTYEPSEVYRLLADGLVSAGYPQDEIDKYAVCLLKAACAVPVETGAQP